MTSRLPPGFRRKLTVAAHATVLLLGLVVIGFGLAARPAEARPAETWVVVDAFTGQIVSEHDSDTPNYPASLTKMMTLYLAFDALERGRITLDSRFLVSNHAARQAPSKLGLVPGESISVRDLILAMVTKSANDAAVTMAEGLAGTESNFAARMTKTAHALGMKHTQFLNASGLPQRAQMTTARDIATLAIALYRDFPKQYAFFATESFTWRGETFGNHNHLMEAFEGMDGIKTGFINASGFNLAASAVRNGRRLVGVVLGGRSAESRDMAMAELLDDGFAHRSTPVGTMLGANLRSGSRSVAEITMEDLAPIHPVAATVATGDVATPSHNQLRVAEPGHTTIRTATMGHTSVHGLSGRFAVTSVHHRGAFVLAAATRISSTHRAYHHSRYGGRTVIVWHRYRGHLYARAVLVSHRTTCHSTSHHHCAPTHHRTVTAMASFSSMPLSRPAFAAGGPTQGPILIAPSSGPAG